MIAEQRGNSFTPFISKVGGDIDLLTTGIKTTKAMFVDAQRQNTFITWEVRICGLLLMWGGLYLTFKPLSTMVESLPYLSELMNIGFSLSAFLISLPCALITIAMA